MNLILSSNFFVPLKVHGESSVAVKWFLYVWHAPAPPLLLIPRVCLPSFLGCLRSTKQEIALPQGKGKDDSAVDGGGSVWDSPMKNKKDAKFVVSGFFIGNSIECSKSLLNPTPQAEQFSGETANRAGKKLLLLLLFLFLFPLFLSPFRSKGKKILRRYLKREGKFEWIEF